MTDSYLEMFEVGVRAKYPALYLVTHEERRVVREVAEVTQKLGYRLMVWSIASGISEHDYQTGNLKALDPDMRDPVEALAYIDGLDAKCAFFLTDFHDFLEGDVVCRRKFREVAHGLRVKQKSMCVISPVLEIPATLEKLITVIDVPVPSRDELTSRLDNMVDALKAKSAKGKFLVALDEDSKEHVVNAGLGLTREEFDMTLGQTLVRNQCLDERAVRIISREKRQIVKKSGLMEFYESDDSMAGVGGLDSLKDWLKKRGRAFSQEARDYGLPQPKGALLVGVPGCGKSLAAKAAAALWQLPLIRLDMGALFGGLVGESESNARKAIQTVEAVAPCVLWLDEIEKGMSGLGSSNQSDGGTTARVFSTFLTWMNDKDSPVFVFATANDVTALPPELLRKGRFDEIFAVDVPTSEERVDILSIHLKKRNRNPEDFDLAGAAQATDQFSGAELEAVVVDALYEAFYEDRQVTEADLVKAANETVPLAKTMAERIEAMRKWAATRARSASSLAKKAYLSDGSGGSALENIADDLDLFDE